jgi:hypothetical protein
MHRMKLYRLSQCDKQTMSRFMVNGYTCPALELPWQDNQKDISRIPAGTYPITHQISPTFGASIRLHDVPGRENIVVHFGNFVGSLNPRTGRPDSRGCPIPGLKFVDIDGDGIMDVSDSKTAVNQLIAAWGQTEGFIEVSDKFLLNLTRKDYIELARVEGYLI